MPENLHRPAAQPALGGSGLNGPARPVQRFECLLNEPMPWIARFVLEVLGTIVLMVVSIVAIVVGGGGGAEVGIATLGAVTAIISNGSGRRPRA